MVPEQPSEPQFGEEPGEWLRCPRHGVAYRSDGEGLATECLPCADEETCDVEEAFAAMRGAL